MMPGPDAACVHATTIMRLRRGTCRQPLSRLGPRPSPGSSTHRDFIAPRVCTRYVFRLASKTTCSDSSSLICTIRSRLRGTCVSIGRGSADCSWRLWFACSAVLLRDLHAKYVARAHMRRLNARFTRVSSCRYLLSGLDGLPESPPRRTQPWYSAAYQCRLSQAYLPLGRNYQAVIATSRWPELSKARMIASTHRGRG